MDIYSLAQVLEEREHRSSMIQSTIAEVGAPVIELSLNTPGPEKNSLEYEIAFLHLVHDVQAELQREGMETLIIHYAYAQTAPFALLVINDPKVQLVPEHAEEISHRIKERMVRFEDEHPLGRLYDIDVFSPDGIKLSRGADRQRTCLLCDRPAHACRRDQSHTIDELSDHIDGLLRGGGRASSAEDLLARSLGHLTQKALLTEVLLTPKPGLVDMENSGAHEDMHLGTFLSTTASLGDAFRRIAEAGLLSTRTQREYPAVLFEEFRRIGLDGERAMFEVSGGVNTQKGAIFTLGLILGAVCIHLADECLQEGGRDLDIKTGVLCDESGFPAVRRIIKGMCKGLVARELSSRNALTEMPSTYGERLHHALGVSGARGEAESGFPTAFAAYERLRAYMDLPGSPYFRNLQLSSLQVLMEIMMKLEDTNILGRSGCEALQAMRDAVHEYLSQGGVAADIGFVRLRSMGDLFAKQGLSAGGAADNLAAALLLYFLTHKRDWYQNPM